MDREFDVVSGDFEGTFYTHQKSVLTPSEWNSSVKDHAIHLYRGELKNIQRETVYDPEKQVNRESLLLHNVTNVQFHLRSDSGENQSRIFDFEQLLIRNAEIKDSWELNGKTYGIVRGSILGKVRKAGSHFDPTNPPPPGSPEIPRIGPDDGNRFPPRRDSSEFFRTVGGCFSGLLTNLWRLLLALILLLIFWWLLRSCSGFGPSDNDCCSERDSLVIQNDSLLIANDSLRRSNNRLEDSIRTQIIQDELDEISSEIFFYGGTVRIREYSLQALKRIVRLLQNYPNRLLEVRGYYNSDGSPLKELPEYNNATIDFARALRIKELLVEMGANPDQLNCQAMGRSTIDAYDDRRTVIIGEEKFEWNRNMRVELVILK